MFSQFIAYPGGPNCKLLFQNRMAFNAWKRKEMDINFIEYSLPSNNPFYVYSEPVEVVSSYKLLGELITDDLSWNAHAVVLKKIHLVSLRSPSVEKNWCKPK